MRVANLLLGACLLCVACSSTDGGPDDGTQDGGNAGGGGSGGTSGSGGTGASATSPSPVPNQSGIPIVDRLGAAASLCGYQSPSTVPVGWDTASFGQGCSIWGPSSWGFEGAGTQMIFVSDPTHGAVVGGGVPDAPGPASCTPRGVAEYFLGLYQALGCSAPKLEYYADGTLLLVDDPIPVGHSVFTCDYQGTPMVGYQFTMGMQDVMCSIVLSAFWEPQSDVESMTCTLTQILNSVSCPTGGSSSCEDVDCDTACRNAGQQGGRCPSSGGEGCECW